MTKERTREKALFRIKRVLKDFWNSAKIIKEVEKEQEKRIDEFKAKISSLMSEESLKTE